MEYSTSVAQKEELDFAPAVESRLAPGGLEPDREERRILSHVWAHRFRQVMRELEPRQSVLAANERRWWMAEEKWGCAFDCSAMVVR